MEKANGFLTLQSETLSIHTEGEDGKLNEIKTINFKIKNIVS